MSSVLLEPMGTAHLPGVLRIESVSFSTPWSGRAFREEIEREQPVAWVAMEGTRVEGYAVAMHTGEEAHILKLAVDPRHRRQGIGLALTKRVLEELRLLGCRSVSLEVRTTNRGAIVLYEKFGFRREGTRRAYYALPEENAVLMTLRLRESAP